MPNGVRLAFPNPVIRVAFWTPGNLLHRRFNLLHLQAVDFSRTSLASATAKSINNHYVVETTQTSVVVRPSRSKRSNLDVLPGGK